MTKAQFMALPAAIALGVLYDLEPRLAAAEAPRAPSAPKFDSRVSRKGGMYCWASEMQLESLEYWQKKNEAGATDGSQYAEKNGKQAKALSYWCAYRRAFPSDVWTGERNRQKVRADPPSREPRLYAWEARGEDAPAPTAGFGSSGGGGFSDVDYGPDPGESDIPFATNVTNEPAERWWKRT